MQQTYGTKSKAKLIGSILAIIVIAGIVIVADQLKSKNSPGSSLATTSTSSTSQPSSNTDSTAATTTTPSTTATNSSSSAATSSTNSYTDGTYSATSSYYVPHGDESIKVSVTIKNGVISDSSIENSEGDHESAQYQEDFASTYKSYVVGKSINGLQLSRVAGASDTTQGFNDALEQIASQAKA